jgi:signal transduction histidine kinase
MSISDQDGVEWLSVVAHDLKTPINAVRNALQLMQQLGPLNENQTYYAARALTNLQRMEVLVGKILDISWVDANVALDLTPVALTDLIEEAVEPLREVATGRRITLQMQIERSLPQIMLDRRRIYQVIDNLVGNAIKYNRDGGQVFVQVHREIAEAIVTVKDTGIGIHRHDQDRIFERYFRSRDGLAMKIEGTGLGLAITRAIVERHGGRIWFESRAGEGTSFYVALPLRAEPGQEIHNPRLADGVRLAGESTDDYIDRTSSFPSEASDVVDDRAQENTRLSYNDHTADKS